MVLVVPCALLLWFSCVLCAVLPLFNFVCPVGCATPWGLLLFSACFSCCFFFLFFAMVLCPARHHLDHTTAKSNLRFVSNSVIALLKARQLECLAGFGSCVVAALSIACMFRAPYVSEGSAVCVRFVDCTSPHAENSSASYNPTLQRGKEWPLGLRAL